MVLEAYAPLAWKIVEGVLEFVVGTIGVLSRNVPILEIYGEALAAVQVAGDARSVASQTKGVPFAHRLGQVLGGSYTVVEGPV